MNYSFENFNRQIKFIHLFVPTIVKVYTYIRSIEKSMSNEGSKRGERESNWLNTRRLCSELQVNRQVSTLEVDHRPLSSDPFH